MGQLRKFYEIIEGGGGTFDPYKQIKILNEIISVKEKERQQWAEMCIKKQSRIEELEKEVEDLKPNIGKDFSSY